MAKFGHRYFKKPVINHGNSNAAQCRPGLGHAAERRVVVFVPTDFLFYDTGIPHVRTLRVIKHTYSADALHRAPATAGNARAKISAWSHCREEGAALEETYQEYQPKGVDFLGIDAADNNAAAQAYVRAAGKTYPSLRDTDETLVLRFKSILPGTSVASAIETFGASHYEQSTAIQ